MALTARQNPDSPATAMNRQAALFQAEKKIITFTERFAGGQRTNDNEYRCFNEIHFFSNACPESKTLNIAGVPCIKPTKSRFKSHHQHL
jgi:hypothetical protein